MAVLKCQNPQCDYFQKPIPEGDFCPFCGEPTYAPIKQPDKNKDPHPVENWSHSNKTDSSHTIVEPIGQPQPVLKMRHTSGQQFVRLGGKSYIGRQGGREVPNPEIDLSNIPYAERISRPHACIYWDERSQKYMITDENSSNGTILNGQSLQPKTSYSLKDGDELELGREQKIKFTLSIG